LSPEVGRSTAIRAFWPSRSQAVSPLRCLLNTSSTTACQTVASRSTSPGSPSTRSPRSRARSAKATYVRPRTTTRCGLLRGLIEMVISHELKSSVPTVPKTGNPTGPELSDGNPALDASTPAISGLTRGDHLGCSATIMATRAPQACPPCKMRFRSTGNRRRSRSSPSPHQARFHGPFRGVRSGHVLYPRRRPGSSTAPARDPSNARMTAASDRP
jgi:hypothetical protein